MSDLSVPELVRKLNESGREALILSTQAEYATEPALRKLCDNEGAYVNGQLLAARMPALTAAEIDRLGIFAG